MEFKIENIRARQILDSRGEPTIEVEVYTKKAKGRASAPSGASKGKYEAFEIRDEGKEFHGKSVMKAVENVDTIIKPALKGMDVRKQKEIDKKLIEIDGTKNKSILGANTCISVSMACCRCASNSLNMPLYEYLNKDAKIIPIPFMNIINGGLHAGNDLAIQEHMLVPIKAKSFSHAIQIACETYYSLKQFILKKFGRNAINVGDEGGFAPPISKTEDALELIMKAIDENGYENEIFLAIDAAASNFYENGSYVLNENERYESNEFIDYYIELAKKYPIISIEDAFHEEDWSNFSQLTEKMGGKVQIVGDDLFVTNAKRLRKGIKNKACNALLLKPNQIGTLSEAINVAKLCFENNYAVMVSHRSGETCDDFIADLSVALQCFQIKAGAPARGERIAKYNRLLSIEEEMENPIYGGKKWKKWGY